MKLRRVLALVLALLLALSLAGCAAPADAAVLCSAEAAPAGRAMAEAGADYREILTHYYTGVTVAVYAG